MAHGVPSLRLVHVVWYMEAQNASAQTQHIQDSVQRETSTEGVLRA